jgi:hypothetical protein
MSKDAFAVLKDRFTIMTALYQYYIKVESIKYTNRWLKFSVELPEFADETPATWHPFPGISFQFSIPTTEEMKEAYDVMEEWKVRIVHLAVGGSNKFSYQQIAEGLKHPLGYVPTPNQSMSFYRITAQLCFNHVLIMFDSRVTHPCRVHRVVHENVGPGDAGCEGS